MSPDELNKRGMEVSARLQNVVRRTKQAMENEDLPSAIALSGKDGVKVARAMMITSMPPDKIVILCEGNLERVVLELEACVATMEQFIDDVMRQKKDDPDAVKKAENEALRLLQESEDEDDGDRPCTFQFAAPNRLQ